MSCSNCTIQINVHCFQSFLPRPNLTWPKTDHNKYVIKPALLQLECINQHMHQKPSLCCSFLNAFYGHINHLSCITEEIKPSDGEQATVFTLFIFSLERSPGCMRGHLHIQMKTESTSLQFTVWLMCKQTHVCIWCLIRCEGSKLWWLA